jgi:hypothetical protein
MKSELFHIDINSKDEIIYKGVNLGITRGNLQDYKLQTGHDPEELILNLYKNSITVLRDKKLNQILK